MVEMTRAKVVQDGAEVRQEGARGRPRWAEERARMGKDEAKMRPRWAKMDSRVVAILRTLCKNCILKKRVFRLGGSGILRLWRADMRPGWAKMSQEEAKMEPR